MREDIFAAQILVRLCLSSVSITPNLPGSSYQAILTMTRTLILHSLPNNGLKDSDEEKIPHEIISYLTGQGIRDRKGQSICLTIICNCGKYNWF